MHSRSECSERPGMCFCMKIGILSTGSTVNLYILQACVFPEPTELLLWIFWTENWTITGVVIARWMLAKKTFCWFLRIGSIDTWLHMTLLPTANGPKKNYTVYIKCLMNSVFSFKRVYFYIHAYLHRCAFPLRQSQNVHCYITFVICARWLELNVKKKNCSELCFFWQKKILYK